MVSCNLRDLCQILSIEMLQNISPFVIARVYMVLLKTIEMFKKKCYLLGRPNFQDSICSDISAYSNLIQVIWPWDMTL